MHQHNGLARGRVDLAFLPIYFFHLNLSYDKTLECKARPQLSRDLDAMSRPRQVQRSHERNGGQYAGNQSAQTVVKPHCTVLCAVWPGALCAEHRQRCSLALIAIHSPLRIQASKVVNCWRANLHKEYDIMTIKQATMTAGAHQLNTPSQSNKHNNFALDKTAITSVILNYDNPIFLMSYLQCVLCQGLVVQSLLTPANVTNKAGPVVRDH